MKKILTIAFCLWSFIPTHAEAVSKTGVYIAPKFVYSFVSTSISELGTNVVDTNDSVFGVALAFGYDFNATFDMPIRTEFEWNMHSQSEKEETYAITGIGNTKVTNNIGIQTLFINAYFDFHNASQFTPYFGAGIGVAFVDVEATLNENHTIEEKTTTNVAWNVGLGVAYAFTSSLSLDLNYRYAQFGKGKTTNSTYSTINVHAKTDTIDAHQAMLALRYTF